MIFIFQGTDDLACAFNEEEKQTTFSGHDRNKVE